MVRVESSNLGTAPAAVRRTGRPQILAEIAKLDRQCMKEEKQKKRKDNAIQTASKSTECVYTYVAQTHNHQGGRVGE